MQPQQAYAVKILHVHLTIREQTLVDQGYICSLSELQIAKLTLRILLCGQKLFLVSIPPSSTHAAKSSKQ